MTLIVIPSPGSLPTMKPAERLVQKRHAFWLLHCEDLTQKSMVMILAPWKETGELELAF